MLLSSITLLNDTEKRLLFYSIGLTDVLLNDLDAMMMMMMMMMMMNIPVNLGMSPRSDSETKGRPLSPTQPAKLEMENALGLSKLGDTSKLQISTSKTRTNC